MLSQQVVVVVVALLSHEGSADSQVWPLCELVDCENQPLVDVFVFLLVRARGHQYENNHKL